MSEELKPCPFCGQKIKPPKSRQASTDRSEGFVAFAACYCGGYSATAHKMGRGNTEAEAIQEVIALWNRRAQPPEAETLMKWKQTAEYWYGQYRLVKHGESPAEYPTKGKLDDWHNSYHNH